MTEIEKKESNIKTQKKYIKIIGVIFILIVIIKIFGDKEQKKPKEKIEYKQNYTTPYIKEDTSAHAVYYYLKDNLTDPTDFKIISTSAVFKLSNGMFLQHITFKAKNKFGVLIENNLSFLMEGTGFNAVVLVADEREKIEKALNEKNIVIEKGYRKTQSEKI